MRKRCSKCKKRKRSNQFSPHKASSDGLQSHCRACHRIYSRAWNAANADKKQAWAEANREKVKAARDTYNEANPEKVRAARQRWAEANPEKLIAARRAWDAENKEKKQAWVDANRERVRAHKRRWDQANQEKKRAHTKVNNAIRDGRLTREPCQKCGNLNSHAHHADYSKPFEIVWLCPKHHGKAHRKF